MEEILFIVIALAYMYLHFSMTTLREQGVAQLINIKFPLEEVALFLFEG